MEIRKYSQESDYIKILELFKSEKTWKWFLEENNILKHKKSLKESITYVAIINNEIIGYSRSVEDIESYIYVCELLVKNTNRGNSIGKQILNILLKDYPSHEVYVMSDEDEYYKKMGYSMEGSIFKL